MNGVILAASHNTSFGSSVNLPLGDPTVLRDQWHSSWHAMTHILKNGDDDPGFRSTKEKIQ